MGQLWLIIIFIAVLVLMSFLANRDKKKKVVFFGDSITEAGTQEYGYITVIREMLLQQNISNYILIAAGVGGDKIYDLYTRIDNDVLAKSPQIVVVYAGVNDVWHKKITGIGTDVNEFEKSYRLLCKRLISNEIKVVVCTPALIGEKNNSGNELDDDLDQCCRILRNVASDLHFPLVDLRKTFIEYELRNNINNVDKGLLTIDGVHLNKQGNKLAAELMWNVIKEIK